VGQIVDPLALLSGFCPAETSRGKMPQMPERRIGPGLQKVRHPPPIAKQQRRLWRLEPHWIHAWFEHADILSEGAARDGAYFGTTSILIDFTRHKPAKAVQFPLGVLQYDPHVRVYALRLARREAQVRSASPLATVHSELTFQVLDQRLVIRVDVESKQLIALRRRSDGRGASA
jgi:hypothetical protein